MLGAGCSRPHTLKVVEIYQEDIEANDGVIRKSWRTTVELENGTRDILWGKYAVTNGDTFRMNYNRGVGWEFEK